MGLLTKEVKVYLGNGAIRRYEELGYKIPRVEKIYYHPNGSVSHRRYSVPRGTYITVNVEDLPPNSCLKVDCECDDCYKPLNMTYQTYLNTNHDGLTYCKSCAYKHTHIGENNPRWNPNKTDEERIKGRTSDSYLKFIRTVLERDKFTCVCCDKYTTKHDLEVHHLNGYEWFEEGRTDINNAVTLCKNCHSNFHSIYGYGGNTKEQFEEWIKKSIDYIQNLHTELSPTKRIYCYETNTVYESARHTKEFLGLNGTSGIYACCLHQKLNRKYNGYHFLFEDEYLSMTKEELDEYCSYKPKIEHKTTQKGKHPLAKKCICIETKEVFDCMQEAIDKYNACCVRECCNGTRKYSGKLSDGTKLHWMYYKEYVEKFGEVVKTA